MRNRPQWFGIGQIVSRHGRTGRQQPIHILRCPTPVGLKGAVENQVITTVGHRLTILQDRLGFRTYLMFGPHIRLNGHRMRGITLNRRDRRRAAHRNGHSSNVAITGRSARTGLRTFRRPAQHVRETVGTGEAGIRGIGDGSGAVPSGQHTVGRLFPCRVVSIRRPVTPKGEITLDINVIVRDIQRHSRIQWRRSIVIHRIKVHGNDGCSTRIV